MGRDKRAKYSMLTTTRFYFSFFFLGDQGEFANEYFSAQTRYSLSWSAAQFSSFFGCFYDLSLRGPQTAPWQIPFRKVRTTETILKHHFALRGV